MRASRHDDHRTSSEIIFSMPGEDGDVLHLVIDVTTLAPQTMRVVDELVRRWDAGEHS